MKLHGRHSSTCGGPGAGPWWHAAGGGPFVEWRAECDAATYPPRAHVGRYLGSGLALLLRRAPGNSPSSCTARPCGRCEQATAAGALDGSFGGDL